MLVDLSVYDAVGDGNVHYVKEWLVGGNFDLGYNSLSEIQIDYPHVESLYDSIDWAIVQSAFNNLEDKGTILFEEGKVYVFDKAVVVEGKSFDVCMTGATVKMAANSSYNAFMITNEDSGGQSYVNWMGGTFDGNKDEIDWPGSQSLDTKFIGYHSESDAERYLVENMGTWRYDGDVAANTVKQWSQYVEYSNNGLLGIRNFESVVIEGVNIVNSISDGVVLYNVEYGMIKNSTASGGAPFNFGDTLSEYGRGFQSTYFKARQDSKLGFEGGTFIIDNVHTHGGSIAFQISSPPSSDAPKNSHLIIKNSSSQNANQDAVHVEQSRRVDIMNSNFTQDEASYSNKIHIGNETEYAEIIGVTMVGNKIDFQEASNLVSGSVVNSVVINDFANSDIGIGNATLVSGTSVSVVSGTAIYARSVIDSDVLGFEDVAIKGAKHIENVKIDNLINGSQGEALGNFGGVSILNSSISNVSSGVTLRDGDVEIINSQFENIGGNAIRVVSLDSLTLESVVFKEYGISSNGIDDSAAIYARNYWGADVINISDTTYFLSEDGNEEFSNSKGLQSLNYYTLEDSRFTGDEFDNKIQGDANSQKIIGFGGDDIIFGKDGDDVLLGDSGDDRLFGGAQNDFLEGGLGNDFLDGGSGRDVLLGGRGDDILNGGDGSDILNGGEGRDILIGGGNRNHLYGGLGDDTFVFEYLKDGDHDVIHDFSAEEGDLVDIANILLGVVSPKENIEDFIRVTGENLVYLWVDQDGKGNLHDFVILVGFSDLSVPLDLDSFIF